MRHKKFRTPQVAALIGCLLFYIVGIVTYAIYNAENSQKNLLDSIDKQLLLAATSLKYMLAEDFHDRAVAPDSIPMPEIDRNRRVISRFAEETEFVYVYTVVKYKDKYYFAAPTVTDEELKQKKNWYFHPYKDIPPEFVQALKADKPAFLNYHDQWGFFRSVALPQTAPGGARYLACVDYDIGYLAGLRQRIYLYSALAGVFFLVLSIPFLLLFRYVYNKHAGQLVRMNLILKEHRDNLEQLVEIRTRDLIGAKEEAEQASRTKTVFLANVSHELRTPLNGILGYAERISQLGGSDEVKGHAEVIVGQAEHMLSLINELLDHTKVVAGQVSLSPHPFKLSGMLASVVEATKPQAKNKNLKYSLTMDPAIDGRLLGDAKRIKQVLINLVGNAIKFTQKGGVSLLVEQLDRNQERVTLRFTVTDTGVGIPPDKLEAVFGRFVQLEHPSLGQQSGTGLGTTIAKNLVEMMGGEIRVSSSPSAGGAKFWFDLSLPITEAPEKARSIPWKKLERAAVAGEILLVEDHEVNQALITAQLTDIGQRVTTAGDGEKAVSLASQRKFDLILMDVQLPGINGIEASRRIRRGQGPNRNTPIVALTASADADTEKDCAEAGIQQVQTKPLRMAKLTGLIRFWLESGSDPQEDEGRLRAATMEVPMDWDLSLQEFLGDADLLKNVSDRFCSQAATQIGQIREAAGSGDAETVIGLAHSIKGGAANLNAVRLANLASMVEEMGRQGGLEQVSEPIKAMSAELARLRNFLTAMEG